MEPDISSLLNSLSDADMARLRETAQAVFGSVGASRQDPVPQTPALRPDGEILATVSKMAGLFGQTDPRSELLYALKPFLSDARKKKADQAATMLKMLRIVDGIRGRT